MQEVYNLRDSFRYYRKELLKTRVDNVRKFAIEPLKKTYVRYPLLLIERLEKENNIVPAIEPNETLYNDIVHGYLKFMMQKVFEGHDIRLGAKLGTIGIRGRKVKPMIGVDGKIIGVIPSWSKTKQLWDSDPVAKEKKTLVYCFNEHTDGVRYKIGWYKKNVVVKNKVYYSLRFTKGNKRSVWKLANEGKEYLVME
jgi:hypothetical protein